MISKKLFNQIITAYIIITISCFSCEINRQDNNTDLTQTHKIDSTILSNKDLINYKGSIKEWSLNKRTNYLMNSTDFIHGEFTRLFTEKVSNYIQKIHVIILLILRLPKQVLNSTIPY